MIDEIEGKIYQVQVHEMTSLRHIRQTIEALPREQRQTYIDLIIESAAAGRSIGLHAVKSHRRIYIATGVLLLMEDGQYDAELVMSICEHLTSKQYQTAGEALASLDHEQAQGFASICRLIKNDIVVLEYIPESNNFKIKEQAS